MDLQPLNIQTHYLTDLPQVSQQIIDVAADKRILLFYGEMGAGKTTLITQLCRLLGVQGEVSSPTFSIVNQYQGTDTEVYHFDFYRLKNEEEALDMGYEEYFYSGAWCLVEWPEKIAGLLPEHYLKISLKVTGQTSREIIIQDI